MSSKATVKMCVMTTIPFTMRVFLVDQLVFLSQNGFEITLICDYDPEFARDCPQELMYHPVHLERNVGPISTLKAFFKIWSFFRKTDFDIVQYCTPKAALLGSVAGAMTRIPVRLYCQWGIRFVGFTGPMRCMFKLLEKLCCYCSTDIAPDSFGNLRFAIKQGLYPPDKGTVVYNGSANGVDMTRFDPEKRIEFRKEIRSELNLPDDGFVFGYLGRITRDKGINELVQAFIEMAENDPDIYLLIVGPLEGDTLSQETRDYLNTFPRIVQLGHQNQPEKYLAAMDVMVLPSYREGFGQVLIEAQAIGVPVISSDISGPREAILHEKTGLLFSVHDYKAMYLALKRLRESPETIQEYRKNGIDFVREKFEQRNFWQKMLEHRQTLLRKRKLLS
ncbi:MAG: glycosyltransferase family 4 protein [Syntrophomonadaceae bacterium]|nr:glycosyltransferase family 4 protein [Syntrophomonadaceae bacterium]